MSYRGSLQGRFKSLDFIYGNRRCVLNGGFRVQETGWLSIFSCAGICLKAEGTSDWFRIFPIQHPWHHFPYGSQLPLSYWLCSQWDGQSRCSPSSAQGGPVAQATSPEFESWAWIHSCPKLVPEEIVHLSLRAVLISGCPCLLQFFGLMSSP